MGKDKGGGGGEGQGGGVRVFGCTALVYHRPGFKPPMHVQSAVRKQPLSKQHSAIVPSMSGHLPLLGQEGGVWISQYSRPARSTSAAAQPADPSPRPSPCSLSRGRLPLRTSFSAGR